MRDGTFSQRGRGRVADLQKTVLIVERSQVREADDVSDSSELIDLAR